MQHLRDEKYSATDDVIKVRCLYQARGVCHLFMLCYDEPARVIHLSSSLLHDARLAVCLHAVAVANSARAFK